ncbi:hypothetical protein PROFUN_11435 [Planoprotostelium fungivorum]|uniref:Uncharacterized protein n=1 Tax=Planoprotostelium fungivorum TaxID=1890364 RepID=A0A2P6NAB6_9EUKA|nr:hypothetical protein PROFUN_11435 [Planoprotostelium fungivorum]
MPTERQLLIMPLKYHPSNTSVILRTLLYLLSDIRPSLQEITDTPNNCPNYNSQIFHIGSNQQLSLLFIILQGLRTSNTLQLWIQNSFAADDSVPDTKRRIHEFITFKLKLAKSQQGGCKGYTVDAGLKNGLS